MDAIKKTSYDRRAHAVMTGPVAFNETGDNANASSATIQILGAEARGGWPKTAAEQKFVLPRPKR